MTFSLSSSFLPSSEELLKALSLESELEGTVIDFSDSGDTAQAFALVEVVRKQTVIVPVEKLTLCGSARSS